MFSSSPRGRTGSWRQLPAARPNARRYDQPGVAALGLLISSHIPVAMGRLRSLAHPRWDASRPCLIRYLRLLPAPVCNLLFLFPQSLAIAIPNKRYTLLATVHPQVSDGTAAPAGDAPDAAAGAAAAAADPAALYREWLQRQYGIYVSHLMAVVTGSATGAQGSSNGQGQQQPVTPPAVRSAGVQVCAAAALMECVRSEQGPGVFAGALFGQLLGGVLVAPGVAPEVFALLFSKYLQLAGGCELARRWGGL